MKLHRLTLLPCLLFASFVFAGNDNAHLNDKCNPSNQDASWLINKDKHYCSSFGLVKPETIGTFTNYKVQVMKYGTSVFMFEGAYRDNSTIVITQPTEVTYAKEVAQLKRTQTEIALGNVVADISIKVTTGRNKGINKTFVSLLIKESYSNDKKSHKTYELVKRFNSKIPSLTSFDIGPYSLDIETQEGFKEPK